MIGRNRERDEMLTFVLSEFVESLLAEFKKFDLLGEDVERHVDRPPESPVRLIIVQYSVEAGPIPVEKVLVPQRVKVAHTSLRVAQQRIGKIR